MGRILEVPIKDKASEGQEGEGDSEGDAAVVAMAEERQMGSGRSGRREVAIRYKRRRKDAPFLFLDDSFQLFLKCQLKRLRGLM